MQKSIIVNTEEVKKNELQSSLPIRGVFGWAAEKLLATKH
jgi:hypothetical protein